MLQQVLGTCLLSVCYTLSIILGSEDTGLKHLAKS